MSVPNGGGADFDFLIGTWSVRNRRLTERLAGSDTWEEFTTRSICRPLWDGVGNVDEIQGDTPNEKLHGATLRLFDPLAAQWRLYWANQRVGVLDIPVIGAFRDGRGEFFSQELFDGRPIFVRYVWSEITTTSCRWEQAYSADGGRSWETNWVMEFIREE